MTDSKTCHCGKPAVTKCPCCNGRVCEEHRKLIEERLKNTLGTLPLELLRRMEQDKGLDA